MDNSSRTKWTGVAAAAVALGITELLAGLLSAGLSVVVSVGNMVIDLAPERLVKFGIRVFGVYDKPVLVATIILVILLLGGAVGRVAGRRLWLAAAAFMAFALIGWWAAARDPLISTVPAGIASLVGSLVGAGAFVALSKKTGEDASRRQFLIGMTAAVGLAAVTATTGRLLINRMREVAASRAEVILPRAFRKASLPADAEITVDGISPLVTPIKDFYRIDTAISIPRVDLETWRLKFTGLVDRPLELSFLDLLDMPMVEPYITLSCVSNRVGGDLIGHALWQGVPLRDLLGRAGVRDEATQLVGRSVDGFEVGFPTEAAYDGREAMVAVAMNGEPLPFEHGFPARLVVAGLYGYVSATKWLEEIELTTWEDFDGYWIPRGWAKEAPIKTQSRIDVPDRDVAPGRVPVAGVAWAPNRGIAKVEVQIDGGAWSTAELSPEVGKDSWRQWVYDWDASSGEHTIRVRATDRNGETQTEEISSPAPDGATGYHSKTIRVT